MTCSARQYSDQMHCGRCALQWDVNDPAPPQCMPAAEPADAAFLSGAPAQEPRPPGPLPTIVAFAGRRGVGKDTAAGVLLDRGWTNVKFADALKAMLAALYAFRGAGPEEIARLIEGDLKETPTPRLNGCTPRHGMQTLGTDWGRRMIDRDLWVDSTRDRLRQVERAVITDLRFQNEADMIHEMGGLTILIERPRALTSADQHASEALIDTLQVRRRLRNDAPNAAGFRALVERELFLNHTS